MSEQSQNQKNCPFCGEKILEIAKKCRYCGEFLESIGNQRLSPNQHINYSIQDNIVDARLLLIAKPSLKAMLGIIFKGLVLLLVLHFVAISLTLPDIDVPISEHLTPIIILIWVVYFFYIAIKTLALKCRKYTITSDRIQYESGILSRSHDNLDLFRITDLTMRRSLLDRLLGIGSIKVISSDKSHPNFIIYKVSQPKETYDLLKKESLHADRRRGVVHLES